MKNKLVNNKGSFLLEVLLSIVIISVSLTLIIQSMIAALRAVSLTNGMLQASILLENKMDNLMGKATIKTNIDEQGVLTSPYQYALKTESLKDAYQQDLNKVTLKVSFPVKQKNKEITAETYLFNLSP